MIDEKLRTTAGVFARRVCFAVLFAAALSATSCRKAVEKARRNIRFEGIEKIERQGLTGAELVLRVRNDTGHKLVLDEARMDVFYGDSRAAVLLLRERAEVERHATQSVTTRWQLKIADPLALYALVRKADAGDLSQVRVSYAVSGRGGPVPVNISREMVPLSEFLNIFGLTSQDVIDYLK